METIKKKLVLKLKVTNKNIRIRFLKEQDKIPDYTFLDMAKQFGVYKMNGDPDRVLVHKWASENTMSQRMPNKSRHCTGCKKTVYDYIEDWINDGTIK